MKRILSLLLILSLLTGLCCAEEIAAEEQTLALAVEEEPFAYEEILPAEEETEPLPEKVFTAEELAPEEALEELPEAVEPEPEELPEVIEEELDAAASGTWGTCSWTISESGTLLIRAGTGANTGGKCPWEAYASVISTVLATADIVLPQDCSSLFALSWYNGDGFSSNCKSMTLTGLDASHVTNMTRMFYGDAALQYLEFGSFDTRNVTDMNHMFFSCSRLEELDLSFLNTSQVTNMTNMFSTCRSLKQLNVSGFDTSRVTRMGGMFHACYALTSLDLSSFNTASVTNMSGMFYLDEELTSLDVSHFKTAKVTDFSVMFGLCRKLTSLDVSGFDTGSATLMNHMFEYCENLTSLDVSRFNTTKVTDMRWMFGGCSKLAGLNLSGFRTGNVTNLESMFYCCENLTSLDLRSFDTSKVTDMHNLFVGCWRLVSLDLSGFRTERVKSMDRMFQNCAALRELDLSSFSTPALTNSTRMFYGCTDLARLDISRMNTTKATEMDLMFGNCPSLSAVVLGSGFTFNGSGSSVLCTLPNQEWHSKQTGKIYTASGIASARNRIADTYSVFVVNGIAAVPVDTNAARITWGGVECADGYQLYRSDDGGTNWKWLKNNTTYNVNNYALTPGADYQYKVRAYRGEGSSRVYSDFSEAVSVHILGKIENFTVTGKDTNCAFLKWSKVSGCTGYQVFRTVEGSGTYTWVKNATTNQVANYALTPDTTYYYKVRAYIDLPDGRRAYGQYSEGMKVYIQPQVVIRKLAGGSGRITLTWSKAEGCTGCQIFYTEAGTGGDYSWYRNVPAGQTSVTVSGLKPKTDYWFKLRSYVDLPDGSRYYGQLSEAKHTYTK